MPRELIAWEVLAVITRKDLPNSDSGRAYIVEKTRFQSANEVERFAVRGYLYSNGTADIWVDCQPLIQRHVTGKDKIAAFRVLVRHITEEVARERGFRV